MEDTTPNQDYEQNSTMNGVNGSFGYVSHSDNFIHPTAVVEAGAILGKGNHVGAFCLIKKDAKIGNNNRFEAFCSIATEPEHKAYFGKPNKGVVIGNNNVFREFVTVNSGCEKPTILCNGITMLKSSHIGHDSTINSNCTISCNVLIGGHSLLGFGVNMGLGSICHQFSKIGSYAMVGMGSIVTKKSKVGCFETHVGSPAKYLKDNDYWKELFSEEKITEITSEFEKMEL